MFALYLVNCYCACKIFMGVDSSGQWSQDTPSQKWGDDTNVDVYPKSLLVMCIICAYNIVI